MDKKLNNNRDSTLWWYFFFLSVLYLFFFPFSVYISGLNIHDEFSRGEIAVASYWLFLLLVVIGIISGGLLKIKKINIDLKYCRGRKKTRIISLAHIICLLFFIYVLNIDSIDWSVYFNRENRNNGIFVTQEWVVSIIFIQSTLFISIFFWESLDKIEKIMAIATFVLLFVIEIFGLGARRYTMAVVIFYIYKSGILRCLFYSIYGWFLILFSLFVALFFGSFRELVFHSATDNLDWEKLIELMTTSNEFTEIGGGIVKIINLTYDMSQLQLGLTFLNAPIYFIPRSIFDTKPLSLTYQYDIPISIYSELFLNFHLMSAVLILFLSYLIKRISKYGEQKIYSCVAAAYMLDFLRGDFATISYSLTIFFVVYIIFTTNRSLTKLLLHKI